nr:immunoglobulin heavy chain junction region [Macaca mulatta]MOV51974.1 immunoglobulin heavy chain junction region [Macaca mulatta]
CARDHSSFDIW